MHYTVKRIVVGSLGTNCYVIKQEGTRAAVVIDPGDDSILIKSALHDMDAYPALILLTHGHFDHILAVDRLRTEKTQVAIHKADANMLLERDLISGILKENPWPFKKADIIFEDNDRYQSLCGYDFQVIHTPGHTEGSVCYIFDDMMFTGDTLFRGGMGRTDFQGGDLKKMMASLRLLHNMPGDYGVYPGHERESTLSDERKYNPYMRKAVNK
ncbi:MAG: MBL fold metallo-hydrolase [Clostridia bacterium]|nr:MBL fold metallo-hydrolase [Clostridia bacterium]